MATYYDSGAICCLQHRAQKFTMLHQLVAGFTKSIVNVLKLTKKDDYFNTMEKSIIESTQPVAGLEKSVVHLAKSIVQDQVLILQDQFSLSQNQSSVLQKVLTLIHDDKDQKISLRTLCLTGNRFCGIENCSYRINIRPYMIEFAKIYNKCNKISNQVV